MEKYFREEVVKEARLSEYLSMSEKYYKHLLITEEDLQRKTKYLIDILGDVLFTEDMYILFIKAFQRYGGMYDVMMHKDTLLGIYALTKKFWRLTSYAIEEIWPRYIKDFFEEYDLERILKRFLELQGQVDDIFKLFICYLDTKAFEYQQRFIKEASLVDGLKDEYSESFITHIKSLILRKHYLYEDIIKCLPDAALILKDEKHLMDISSKTRIFLGIGEPVSYEMFDLLLEEKALVMYPEVPTYYISTGAKEIATFTKTEFLESVHKRKK